MCEAAFVVERTVLSYVYLVVYGVVGECVAVEYVVLHLELQTVVSLCHLDLTLNRCVSVLDVSPCTLVGNAGLEVGSHGYD